MEGSNLLLYPRLISGLQYAGARCQFQEGTRVYTYGDLRRRAFDAFHWQGRLEQYTMHVYALSDVRGNGEFERRCNSWDSFDSPDRVYFTYLDTTLPVEVMYHAKPCCQAACKCAIL